MTKTTMLTMLILVLLAVPATATKVVPGTECFRITASKLEPALLKLIGLPDGTVLRTEGRHPLTLTVKNIGPQENAIEAVTIKVTVTEKGRKVPLATKEVTLAISGGLQGGEEKTGTWEVAAWFGFENGTQYSGDSDWLSCLDPSKVKMGPRDRGGDSEGTGGYKDVTLKVEVLAVGWYEEE